MMVRPAHLQDAPTLAAILSNWIDETSWMPRLHPREVDEAFVAGLVKEGNVDVLVSEDYPVGFMEETDGHISALYLAPEARGQGGGALLLDCVKLRRDPLDLWTFEANERARQFYARNGFLEVERSRDNPENLPDIRLAWKRDSDVPI